MNPLYPTAAYQPTRKIWARALRCICGWPLLPVPERARSGRRNISASCP